MYPLRYHHRQQRPSMCQTFLQKHEAAQMPLVIPILLPILALMLLPLQSIQVLMPMGNHRRAYSKMGLAMLQRPPVMPTSSHGLAETTRGIGS